MQTQEFKEQLNIIAEDIGNLPEPCRENLMLEILDHLKWEISFTQSTDILNELINEAEIESKNYYKKHFHNEPDKL